MLHKFYLWEFCEFLIKILKMIVFYPNLNFNYLNPFYQVNLRSVGRKRYAHLSDNQDEIHVEENVPWGEDTLFTLEFREEEHKYAIHTCTNMYLQKDGKLSAAINKVKFVHTTHMKVIFVL